MGVLFGECVGCFETCTRREHLLATHSCALKGQTLERLLLLILQHSCGIELYTHKRLEDGTALAKTRGRHCHRTSPEALRLGRVCWCIATLHLSMSYKNRQHLAAYSRKQLQASEVVNELWPPSGCSIPQSPQALQLPHSEIPRHVKLAVLPDTATQYKAPHTIPHIAHCSRFHFVFHHPHICPILP